MAFSTSAFSANRVTNTVNVGIRKRFFTAFYSLWLIVLGGTICLPKLTAQAQLLSTSEVSTSSRTIENGWWCPESRRTIPYLQLSTGDQIHLSNTALISPGPAIANYSSISLLDGPIGKHPAAGLGVGSQRVNPGPVLEAELLLRETLLYPSQSNYSAWESRLEDSGPRTNVNRLLVYPLLRVNYAGRDLPISLYIPPLRGSDRRR